MLLIIELQESVVDRFAFKYFILEVVTLLKLCSSPIRKLCSYEFFNF